MVTNIDERTASSETTLDIDPVEVGSGSSASEVGSMAIGVSAGAFAEGAIALGDDTSIGVKDVMSVGDRDIYITDGHQVVYPADQGNQTLVDLPVTGGSPDGEEHSILFNVGGMEALKVFAQADGVGGIKNVSLDLPGDLDVSSGEVAAKDVIAKSTTIEDSDGNAVMVLDGDTANTALQMFGNNIDGLDKITPTNSELIIDGDLTISGELTENSAV